MFAPPVGWYFAFMEEERRKAAEKEDHDMVARLMRGNATQLEIELAILRAREVRALERRRH